MLPHFSLFFPTEFISLYFFQIKKKIVDEDEIVFFTVFSRFSFHYGNGPIVLLFVNVRKNNKQIEKNQFKFKG